MHQEIWKHHRVSYYFEITTSGRYWSFCLKLRSQKDRRAQPRRIQCDEVVIDRTPNNASYR
jgi:hypothetical protein